MACEIAQNTSMASHTKGIAYVLISAILFSLGGVLIKAVPWSALSISACRSLFAAIVIYAFMRTCGKKLTVNRPILIGALLNFGMLQTFVLATKLTTAGNAIVLQFAQPIWVIVLSWLIYKDRPQRSALVACAFVFLGIGCSFADQLSADGTLGNILAVISGIFYAGVFLIKKMEGSDFESSAVISFIACFVVGLPSLMAEDLQAQHFILSAIQGLLQCGAAYIFLSKGLDRVSPVTASLTSTIEPVLNPILVALVIGEQIGPLAIVGLILVVGVSSAYNINAARKS